MSKLFLYYFWNKTSNLGLSGLPKSPKNPPKIPKNILSLFWETEISRYDMIGTSELCGLLHPNRARTESGLWRDYSEKVPNTKHLHFC